MASGAGAEHHQQHPHLQQQQQQQQTGLEEVVHNAVAGMGGSSEDGDGQAAGGDGMVTGGGAASVVLHQPPVVTEVKGIKKAKREGGEEKKKENPTDWSETAVNYLLEVYEEKYVSLSRGNLRSNDWEDVARYVNFKCEGSRSAKTSEQCKWKMENLKRRYKVEKQRQAATGAVNSLWPFFPRMDVMLASSFKFVATSPENGSADPEEHPPNISIVAASPQRPSRGSHASPAHLPPNWLHNNMLNTQLLNSVSETEAILKKDNDIYGGCAIGSVTIKDLQRRMAEFSRERDWDQFHSPRNLLLALVGEVGELSEIFQWKGEVPRGLPGWNASEKEHLGEELSDVLLYLVRLADVCEVDLGQAALRKLKKNGKKYPVELCKGTARKYTPYDNSHGEDIVLDKA